MRKKNFSMFLVLLLLDLEFLELAKLYLNKEPSTRPTGQVKQK